MTLFSRKRTLYSVRFLVSLLFFGALLVIGLLVYRDYGISWDEPVDHQNGLVSVKYIAGLVVPEIIRQDPSAYLIPDLHGYFDGDHGVLFEVPVALLSYLFTHHDAQAFYFMRHLCIFFTFMLGVWATYSMGSRWLRDWRWGLLAAVILVLSPRLFGEAFFNGKDILFLGVFALAMHTLFRLVERPTWGRAAWHGAATAAAIDVRILGIILVPYTLVVLALAVMGPTTWRTTIRLVALYLIITVFATIAGWPYLWENPPGNFLAAYQKLSHYPWQFTNLYWGQQLTVHELPWHYIPVWIFITTPLPYSLLALVGMASICWGLGQGGWRHFYTAKNQQNLLLLGWLLGPILMVIVLKSAVYDTWRHLYFVYPAWVLLAVRGLVTIITQAQTRVGISRVALLGSLVLFCLETARTAVRMIRMHPFEHVYFSFLPAATAERLFERDYWALSFRQGIEWIVAHNTQPDVQVFVQWPFNHPLGNNVLILPTKQRLRVHLAKQAQGRYFMSTYRWHPESYPDSVGREVYSIRAEGIKILSVFDKEAK